ncbi:MAG TPA: cell envelope integrity protein CreD [Syntrophorhabdaceae bacterium]|nr:cell envelope integrity protein CreD [Syntrophorhabdaceae bacterium]
MADGKLRSSVMLRLFVTMFMALLLLIPATFIRSLISEREGRRNAAAQEVSQKWGGVQTLTGPILTIPFKKPEKNDKNEISFSIDHLHILPDTLHVLARMKPEVRRRGIYEVVLYSASVKLEGNFTLPKLDEHRIAPEHLLLNEAFITMGITDLHGIRNAVMFDLNGARLPVDPGAKTTGIIQTGLTVLPAITSVKANLAFSTEIDLNGSGALNITPVGKETITDISSTWTCPSFIGSSLPEQRRIGPDGFKALWKTRHFNRNFPQAWTGNTHNFGNSNLGVKLHLPVDEYQKVTRAVKYALMFITLTFLAFFLTELFSAAAVHPIQYTLTGLAIVLYYVILLSLSEHMPFNTAYAISSTSTTLLVSMYAKSVLKTKKAAAVIGCVLTSMYLFLFVTLQLEDYALLMGSVGLFIILSLVMYLTRRIDWFSIKKMDGASWRGSENKNRRDGLTGT